MTDYFGDWVSHEQFDEVLEVIDNCPQHTFYMLTKQPQNVMSMLYDTNIDDNVRYLGGGDYIPNLWIGASVTDDKMAHRTKPHMLEVSDSGWHTFVSVEPILGYITPLWLTWAEWIIIGAMSGRSAAKHVPERMWVEDIVNVATADHVPVFLKDSLMPKYADLLRQEWPENKDE
jgi:protein gp37